MHSGVKYTEREKPQVQTVVPPTARLEDILIPVDHVYFGYERKLKWIDNQEEKWTSTPLFPSLEDKKASKDALNYKGRSFSVFIPLEINGAVKNYLFTFSIDIIDG
jgi:hypothetical protein